MGNDHRSSRSAAVRLERVDRERRHRKDARSMLVLKACPHCHGDLAFEQDRHSGYLSCVRCGHILSVPEERSMGLCASSQGLVHLLPLRRAPPPPPNHPRAQPPAPLPPSARPPTPTCAPTP